MKLNVGSCAFLFLVCPGALLAQNFRNPFPCSTCGAAPIVSTPAITIPAPAPGTPVKMGGEAEKAQKKALAGAELLQWKRDKVHVFLINGADPFYMANLNGLGESLRGAGYTNTKWEQFYYAQDFAREISGLKASDQACRVVMIGFSAGALSCRSVANQLADQGVTVDCLCYIGGDVIRNTSYSRPGNVTTLINITGNGFLLIGGNLFFNGEDIDGAINLRLPVRHFGLPGHSSTFELISQQVSRLVNDIPAPE